MLDNGLELPHLLFGAIAIAFCRFAQIGAENIPGHIQCRDPGGQNTLIIDQTRPALAALYQAAGSEWHAQSAILLALQKARQGNDLRFGPDDDLELLLPALAGLLIGDAIRGWLFSINVDGKALAYVITRLDYVAPGNDETGKIVMELKANAKGVIASLAIRISAGDMANRSVREILAAKGFLKETPELIAAYDAEVSRYFEWRGHYGAQYSALGVGFYAEDPIATHRDTDWSRKDVIILSAGEGRARLVNDEGILTARVTTLEVTGDILGPYLRKAAKSNRYSVEEEIGQFQTVANLAGDVRSVLSRHLHVGHGRIGGYFSGGHRQGY